jgi:hypothetical protein
MVSQVAAALAHRTAEEEAERARSAAEDRARRRAEEARAYRLAVAQNKQVREDEAKWHEAERLRAFANAASSEAIARAADNTVDERVRLWVGWVHEIADRIDPLKRQDLGAHLTRDPEPRYTWDSR